MATSVPGADGDPEVGLGKRGGVVDAVADHRHPAARVLQRGDLGGLVAGQHVGDDGVDTELAGDAPGGGLVVAGEHDDLDPEVVQRGHRGGSGGARGVGERDQPGRAAVDGDEHGGPAGSGEFLAARGQLSEVDALALEQAAVPDGDATAGDGGDRAVAGHVLEPGDGPALDPARPRRARRSPGRAGARTRARPRRSSGEQLGLVDVGGDHVGDLGFALGERAGLVHHHGGRSAPRSPARWRS